LLYLCSLLQNHVCWAIAFQWPSLLFPPLQLSGVLLHCSPLRLLILGGPHAYCHCFFSKGTCLRCRITHMNGTATSYWPVTSSGLSLTLLFPSCSSWVPWCFCKLASLSIVTDSFYPFLQAPPFGVGPAFLSSVLLFTGWP
jgi:hypothetical protein